MSPVAENPEDGIIEVRPADLGPEEAAWLDQAVTAIGAFSQLGREQLAKILPYMLLVRYEEGALICKEGDEGDALYLIYKGAVVVTRKDRAEPLAALGEGAVIGEMSLLFGQPRSATVATTVSSELFCLSSVDFQRVMEANPDLVVSMLKIAQLRQGQLRRG